ncbi:alpha/beta fold hydrolase [Prosthecobacter sp.]|uniref:alpha/beta fold hydrolase n=1 Tax=Prosthecobacter sp. TaxID=1965333 RepID=UPI0024887637|nr:alpha/beta fold hydrolase [Prosthecobacter sp.]MDI1314057.1 alpha/beta fold hydrolase [Prosthecobacter sp.]
MIPELPSHAPEGASCVDGAERRAFYFESGGRALFAWLHRPAGAVAEHGVLICPPIGHEQVHSHRALRHLADRLARQGFTVVRLDYHGTGDSDGAEDDLQRLATWQVNVSDAVEWLRSEAGCRKVSLVGLRLGATLAALYAEQHEVESLVLWSPIVKGRRYVRELTALSQTAQLVAGSDSAGIEAMGFVYAHETAGELAKMDLLSRSVQCQQVLIASHANAAGDLSLEEHLLKQGVVTELMALPGYEGMMAEPHETEVPHEALRGIVDWMTAKAQPAVTARGSAPAPGATSMLTCGANAVRESIHQISSTPDLFGIMTEPVEPSTTLPWIVMVNAGAAYRIGPGRIHVALARQLAALGYPCLRLDINGIGDSVVADPDKENDTYAATAFRDVELVCDYLHAQQPSRRIVLLGLCSGAYVAFQAAAQLPHPAIIESILINPLVFFWKEGMTINNTSIDQLVAWREYWNAIFKWRRWKMLLTGRTRTGFAGSVKRFMGHLTPRFQRFGRSAEAGTKPELQSGCGHPAHKDLPGDLSRVAAAGRTLAMFVSDNDPGYFLLMYQARRKATQMMKQGGLQCHFIHQADHTFSTAQARETFYHSLTGHLHQRFGSEVIDERALDDDFALLVPALRE